MIGIDTNILVRFITQDDPYQSAIANAFMASLTADKPGFIPLVTIVELWWVLSRGYKLSRAQCIQATATLLASQQLVIEAEPLVWDALLLVEQTNSDLSDCLIAGCARASGCNSVVTFDRNAVKATGMQLLT
ncbi:PIN domain-containing protein [Acidicapsa ligni]|uniref:PIN domain-containing protein n=1 Tax=Acidicapsa ligni TaxID=542300 RepID=UPI0021E0AE96|nr:type II toxin-antitoxin system VapC family toxin [Acidicapsa ligni]